MRVGPFGLLSIKERMADLKRRRPEEESRLEILEKQGLLVEEELMELTDGKLGKIGESDVKNRARELLLSSSF
jgi:hypothetical protein